MDPVLERISAVNPASETDFAGLTDFDALRLTKPRKRHRRLLAVPALGAIVAALVVLPTSAPQASEILQRATDAIAVDDGILYARSHAQIGPTGGTPSWSGSRQVWVLGDEAMRWLDANGNEEVYATDTGTTRRSSDGKVKTEPGTRMVPTEVFRARGLLAQAQRSGSGVRLDGEQTVDGHDTYLLRWDEHMGAVTTVHTMWVDKSSYAPVRFSDRDMAPSIPTQPDGSKPKGPLDQTYIEDIDDFKTLPDTPENRKLLTLGG